MKKIKENEIENPYSKIKKGKTAISITVNTGNLDFLKKDMKRMDVEDMGLSAVFDSLLEDFIIKRKEKYGKDEKPE